MAKYKREKPLVSIVIPSWFTMDQHGKYGQHETFWFAAECLQKLTARTKPSFELIIVDNGSTINQEVVEEAVKEKKYPGEGMIMSPEQYFGAASILVRNRHNLGFAAGCNQGFNVARGEYVCCVNNDVVVYDGWLDAILKPFVNKEVRESLPIPPGVVMPALARDTRDAHEALELAKPDLEMNAGKFGPGAEFGSLWIAPTALLREVGRTFRGDETLVFDENYALGMGEDRQLWREIRFLGYETYRTHDTRVFHQGNMTIAKVKDRKEFTEKNREYLRDSCQGK